MTREIRLIPEVNLESPLSRPNILDFVRLEGLQKLTSVTAHDWDLYIFKELVDNALDADEFNRENLGRPRVEVEMNYSVSADSKDSWFEITVRNRSAFPLDNLLDIFDLERRVSTKDLYNLPTRGAQGNALKTILGIPYALHYHYFASYNLSGRLKPIYIHSGNQLADVRLSVNERRQHVLLDLPPRRNVNRFQEGTEIYVGLERFIQRKPRRVPELMHLAESFAIFNPHADFDFLFVIDDAEHVFRAEGDPAWQGKYDMRQPAPPTWYTLSEFRDLLHALLRRADDLHQAPPTLGELAQQFGLPEFPAGEFAPDMPLTALEERSGTGDLNHVLVKRLHDLFVEVSASEPELGQLGETALRTNLPNADQTLFFFQSHIQPRTEEYPPFVLETALFKNDTPDARRQIITGINHAPTYRDPFINKPLVPPGKPADNPQRSLEKLLDSYDFKDSDPLTLIVHLISPAVVYENYGKSAITDDAFREPLVMSIDKVVSAYKEATKEPEEVDYLSEPARTALPEVAQALNEAGVPFSQAQILAALKRRLFASGQPEVAAALWSSEATARLAAVLREYLQTNPIPYLTPGPTGRLAMPRHPNDVVHVTFGEQHIVKLLTDFQVRAVVVAGRPELEDLFLLRRFQTRYDLALLRSGNDLRAMIALLVRTIDYTMTEAARVTSSPVALWVLRDATLDGLRLVEQVRAALRERNLPEHWAVDFGLRVDDPELQEAWIEVSPDEPPLDATDLKLTPPEHAFYLEQRRSALLDTLPPETLIAWFERRIRQLGQPVKFMPDLDSLANVAAPQISQKLANRVANLALERMNLEEVENRVQASWREEFVEWKERLHERLTSLMMLDENTHQTWRVKLDDVLEELIKSFLTDEQVKQIRQKIEELA